MAFGRVTLGQPLSAERNGRKSPDDLVALRAGPETRLCGAMARDPVVPSPWSAGQRAEAARRRLSNRRSQVRSPKLRWVGKSSSEEKTEQAAAQKMTHVLSLPAGLRPALLRD